MSSNGDLFVAAMCAEKMKPAALMATHPFATLMASMALCTLLLGNTLVNALIAILAASFTGGVIGGVISTVFILILGEVLTQSVCSRDGLSAGRWCLLAPTDPTITETFEPAPAGTTLGLSPAPPPATEEST